MIWIDLCEFQGNMARCHGNGFHSNWAQQLVNVYVCLEGKCCIYVMGVIKQMGVEYVSQENEIYLGFLLQISGPKVTFTAISSRNLFRHHMFVASCEQQKHIIFTRKLCHLSQNMFKFAFRSKQLFFRDFKFLLR